jgi:hypothetical protein
VYTEALELLRFPKTKYMFKESADCDRAAFIQRLQAANNSITEAQAVEFYNVLDAVQALLATPMGQRIVVNKNKRHG